MPGGPAASAVVCKLGGAEAAAMGGDSGAGSWAGSGSGAGCDIPAALAGGIAPVDVVDTTVAKLDSCAACLRCSCLWDARRSWATARSSPTRAAAPAERTLGSYLVGSVGGGGPAFRIPNIHTKSPYN